MLHRIIPASLMVYSGAQGLLGRHLHGERQARGRAAFLAVRAGQELVNL